MGSGTTAAVAEHGRKVIGLKKMNRTARSQGNEFRVRRSELLGGNFFVGGGRSYMFLKMMAQFSHCWSCSRIDKEGRAKGISSRCA